MTAPSPVRPRTAAASAALRRRGAQTVARTVVERRDDLDDRWLTTLAAVLVAECTMRGLVVPDLLAED
jgi:hypothetical protein